MTSVSTPVTWLAGYIPDIPTPFDQHGAVDLAAFAMLCERQINAGVSAILVSETGGEASHADARGTGEHHPYRRREPPMVASASSPEQVRIRPVRRSN